MINVLINAYGCSPYKGSEAGLGWMWATRLAQYNNIYIITEKESEEDVLKELPNCPYKDNLHFYFIDIGERGRRMCWNQGDWRFYYYYRRYQKQVYQLAKQLHDEIHFDVVHQLNMIGFTEPGFLYKLQNCKYIWGPIGGMGGGGLIPFYKYLGIKSAIFISLKRLSKLLIIKTNFRIKKAINRADLLLACASATQKSIKKYYGKDSVLVNETGINTDLLYEKTQKKDSEIFKIAWVGRIIPTKFLGLAIETIANLDSNMKIELHILGDGKNIKQYQSLAEQLNISDKCIWHGMIAKSEVQKILKNSDLFFFTSLVEGTSHAVMEAIANRLPILCFNTCGHGDIINEKMGIKIPVTTPDNAVKEFSKTITQLYNDRNLLGSYSNVTKEDLAESTWKEKILIVTQLYNELVQET